MGALCIGKTGGLLEGGTLVAHRPFSDHGPWPCQTKETPILSQGTPVACLHHAWYWYWFWRHRLHAITQARVSRVGTSRRSACGPQADRMHAVEVSDGLGLRLGLGQPAWSRQRWPTGAGAEDAAGHW
jgi:hypothetical protein